MEYFEKLKDPRWQKKRLEIFQRDGFRCGWCKSKVKTLNVHHRYYVKGRDPWNYPDWSLVSFCNDCHIKAQDQCSTRFQNFEKGWVDE